MMSLESSKLEFIGKSSRNLNEISKVSELIERSKQISNEAFDDIATVSSLWQGFISSFEHQTTRHLSVSLEDAGFTIAFIYSAFYFFFQFLKNRNFGSQRDRNRFHL